MEIITDNNLNKFSAKVVLKNGSTMIFRPINNEDAQAWWKFYQRLSAEPDCLRVQRLPPNMKREEARRYCSVDQTNQFSLVAEVIEESQKNIIAIGRFTRLPDLGHAEIFLNVLKAYQGNGIAEKLIEWLATEARKQGIEVFQAQVLPEDINLLTIFKSYGFHMQQVLERDLYHISFPLAKSLKVEDHKDERASQATCKSLTHIFKPRSVAVIGASNRPGSMGQLTLQQLLESRFKGYIYPINANYKTILNVKAYPSILDVPGEIDLAVITTPSTQILNIVDECGRKKVKGIVVIADGFREKDEKGAVLEKSMVDTAFGYGMRIIGPNCMGIINTDPEVKLKATFGWISPIPGNISMVSQSGALGQGILEYANSLDIGFANFVSIGNRADISSTDLLQYWEKDPATQVIMLYLESFDNPEIFSRVSRKASLQKPILAIKGGSTVEGSRATRSHTGAMATPGIVSDVLLREAGIVTVNSVGELFESAVLLANQPVPKGKNVVVVSNGGGPGILAADACARHGLKLPELSAITLSRIKSIVKRDININNPIDLTSGVSADEFEATLKILADDSNYDAIITIYVSPSGTYIPAIENAIGKASTIIRENGKPLLACFVGMKKSKGKVMEGRLVPYYVFPEEAVEALSNAVKYREILTQTPGSIIKFTDIEHQKARQLIKNILTTVSERPLWLSHRDMSELFKFYGIRFTETVAAKTSNEAVEVASKIGFPLVIKLNSATITHKTDVGGVILNVKTQQEVREAFDTIKGNLAKFGKENEMQGVVIQHQENEGIEVMVGVSEDQMLGHVIMFGMGGTFAEVMKDTALRLHPLSDIKARDMINSVKISQILKGYRGMPEYDILAIEDLLLRISAMIDDIPQISEMDLNPVKVHISKQGYSVVDGRILIK